MECLEFRRRVESEPGSARPDLVAHEARCASCARFRRRIRQLDRSIRRALLIDVPARHLPSSASWGSARAGRWAFAAAVLLAVGIGIVVRGGRPFTDVDSFVAHAVTHVEHEPESIDAVVRPMDPASIGAVLAAHKVEVATEVPVVYARTCIVDGKRVAHLIVRGRSGAMTVMLLPGVHLAETSPERNVASGRVVSVSGGSMAIVGHGEGIDREAERRIVGAIDWEA